MARKPPRNHGAYKVQASWTSSTLLTEMEQQWHEPQKLNNENNLQLKSCKKENKKKRNQGKAKSEEKSFFLVYRRSELQGYRNIYHNES